MPDDDEDGGAGSGGFSNFYFQRQIQQQFNAVWSASRGAAPGYSRWAGATGSYLSSYRSPSGGHWKKQEYGTGIGSGPTVWQGYDWIWVPGEGEIPVYNVDEYLDDWTRRKISRSSAIKANVSFIPGVRYSYFYIYLNSKQRGQWDLKPRLKEIFPRYNEVLYEFHGELYSYDELGNIAWGRIMAAHGIDPLTAMSAAGAYQMIEVFILGSPKPVNLPFGDDIRDTRAIWRGYNWWRSGR